MSDRVEAVVDDGSEEGQVCNDDNDDDETCTLSVLRAQDPAERDADRHFRVTVLRLLADHLFSARARLRPTGLFSISREIERMNWCDALGSVDVAL